MANPQQLIVNKFLTEELLDDMYVGMPKYIPHIVNQMRREFVEYGTYNAILHIRYLPETRLIQFELRQQ